MTDGFDIMTKRDALQCLSWLVAVIGSLGIALIVAAVHIGLARFD